jgi:anti-sigma regulatory factor (Ser/Thr protein kinase)
VARQTLALDRTFTAPRRARAALADFDHGLTGQRLEDADLLLSELVSNAVKYGGEGEVTVHFERLDECFRAEVVDHGDGFVPKPRDPADWTRPGGWGIPLVEALSDRWGTHQGSTHVWFEIAA